MQKIVIIGAGLLLLTAGGLLAKQFGPAAKRDGIGAFTLLPLAGFVYLAGMLLVIMGACVVLFGIFL